MSVYNGGLSADIEVKIVIYLNSTNEFIRFRGYCLLFRSHLTLDILHPCLRMPLSPKVKFIQTLVLDTKNGNFRDPKIAIFVTQKWQILLPKIVNFATENSTHLAAHQNKLL